ncbi:MAG TPA: tetraacyldisaccharide 4'-kinase [Phycisphaerales bacterium]|nr:tetraacyldisaccharide 4'-kinase [Phycisphaerales bacterium]
MSSEVYSKETMNYEQSYRRLISGQSSGSGASILRFLLAAGAIGYWPVVRLRNLLYSTRLLKAHHVDAAVICVGNITVGGTGKTPLVVWLYNLITQNSKLKTQDCRCAILTRGYKARAHENADFEDEIAIFAESCPEAEVIVNPDRVAGAAEAINKYAAKVLIMDDGFQHRRLARDLDIIAIDATLPFGYGRLFPSGLLREPVTSLNRARAVVITRCDQIDEGELNELENKLLAINPNMVVARSVHAALYAELANNEKINVEQLKGKKIFAFCGIGNPDAFLKTIRTLGAKLAGSNIYDDHYHYTDACLAEISEQAEELGADLILTTQKDWTKVISNYKSQISNYKLSLPFAYLAIEIRFLSGEDKLTVLIKDTLAGKIVAK